MRKASPSPDPKDKIKEVKYVMADLFFTVLNLP